jgi:phosphoribosylanthranilate isomerase
MAVAVKICGIRSARDAIMAAEAGADMIGLVFAPSRRQLDRVTARQIVAGLRASSSGQDVTVVGVFVNESAATIQDMAAEVGLDWVQLSGHESRAAVAALDLPVVKALRFDGDATEAEWLGATATCAATPLLIDAHVAGSYGGAGVVADWGAAARLAAARPVLLAGGLNPDNVAAAIAAVRPWGVDVSSGVETSGTKDHAKIMAFVGAAKAAGTINKQG